MTQKNYVWKHKKRNNIKMCVDLHNKQLGKEACFTNTLKNLENVTFFSMLQYTLQLLVANLRSHNKYVAREYSKTGYE